MFHKPLKNQSRNRNSTHAKEKEEAAVNKKRSRKKIVQLQKQKVETPSFAPTHPFPHPFAREVSLASITSNVLLKKPNE